MDYFANWCGVFPTKDQKAKTVVHLLVSRVFSHSKPPVLLHSDQRRDFESNLMHEVCQLMGTHKSHTTTYHQQFDGIVERQNRTLQEMLAAHVADYLHDWDKWASLAVYTYNTSSHSSIGFSPYEMAFGRMPHAPLELDLDLPLHIPRSQSEYAQSVRQCLHIIKTRLTRIYNHKDSSKVITLIDFVRMNGLHLLLVALSGCIVHKKFEIWDWTI